MDSDLRSEAVQLLARLPLSVEMPAGTGKTQLIAAMASVAVDKGQSVLILTHTNAGVAALRTRIKKFGVKQSNIHVDTIASWAFELVRHYPVLAGIQIPPLPDWSKSSEYVDGAAKVASANAIQAMHVASFNVLMVDEYQDCNVRQHELVTAIANVLPTAVFGDRLQGIFDFKDELLVDWEIHVAPVFPVVVRAHTAWRWKGYNEPLGQWLLDIRDELIAGNTIDLAAVDIEGLTWRPNTHEELTASAFAITDHEETVAIMNRWRGDNVRTANRLGGAYSVMEDLNGRFMHQSLQELEDANPSDYPLWLACFIKKCFTGFGTLDSTVLRRLRRGESTADLLRPEIELSLQALSALGAFPSITNLVRVMTLIERNGEGRLHCHEAWRDTLAALRAVALDPAQKPRDSLALIRDRLRYTGRKSRQRIISRTLLIKGLEYDHGIICGADNFGSLRHLYVGFTRPRKSLTILSNSPLIRLID
ncbi:UvrD-helicase domain-containing protein [Rhodococcus sp. Eu-32]|uniref:UvrD-helicase domain-containing protein n=1 Tax=Rhodococcus sp. Eu-32 TaxID=1017319 RepID=UPI001403EBB4|nr:UvrD-helicase domain-containing protein [Rhodococcus sp. Eu-32]